MQIAKEMKKQEVTQEDSIYTQRIKETYNAEAYARLTDEEREWLLTGMEVLNTFAPNIKELSKY